jgi:molybdate transport system substrate-binding protein
MNMRFQSSMAFTAICLATTTTLGIPAQAAEIKLIASNAVKEIVVDVVPAFEKASGHKVAMTWAGTEAIAKRIAEGEIVDIVLIAAANIDKLIADGKLVAGSRTDIAKSGVAIAVRAGLPKPDVSSRDAVKNAVLNAKSIAYSSGPSGNYLVGLFKTMGIADQIKDKVKQTPSGVQVADVLARGEADLGFQQVSELLHRHDIQYLGPLPPDIQHTTVFSAGLHPAAPQPDAAKALVKFMTAPEAGAIIRKSGMTPG